MKNILMIAVGAGMCLGNYYSGILSDKYSPSKIVLWLPIIITVSLLATYFDNFSIWTASASIIVAASCLFALSSPMQLLLIEYSPGGELLGGAMVQVAFNLGNAIGAYLGGLPISAGHSPETSSLVGTVLAFGSIFVVCISSKSTKELTQFPIYKKFLNVKKIRLIYPQWQGATIVRWIPNIPADEASRGYQN